MRPIENRRFDPSEIWEGSRQRSWLFVGLLSSLLLHSLLCVYFYQTRFQPVDTLFGEREQTPTFNVKKVDLDSKLVEKSSIDQTNPAAKPDPDKTDVQLPDEKKSFDKLLEEVHASAALPDDTSDVLPDTPKVEQTDVTSVLNEIERTTAQTLSQSPNGAREQSLFNDASASGRPQPALTGTELAKSTTIKRPSSFTSKIPGDSAGPDHSRAPGFSDLDQLLSQKGPLGSGTKLRMPDDQLFLYDSADLQASAMSQLQKLGTLIKRNPQATFSIEGYTDSFGPPDYNLQLSQRRAESVKQYLVQVIGISPAQIDARGYGQTKFRVSPNGSIEEQRENRRVEIVVHTTEG
jgi:outer membrane protein OmpA-like peptidoglycan-associated protein